MSKRLGLRYGYTRKACFVCGSFSHLIRDCDFHEKRIAKHVELNKSKNKVTSQRNDTPVWNNVQRLNHQNKFVPTTILTKTDRFPVNAAKQNFSTQAASTSTVRKVNTARQIVNDIRPRDNLFKSHSPIRRPFNITTAPKANFTNDKVNIVGDKMVSAAGGNRETAVKASVEYQYFNGGAIAFGGSKGQITDTECLVLSPDFKLPGENQVLLRVPRQNNMYSFNLENIAPSGGLACLIAKATVDESNKWHRRDIIELCASKGIKREYSNAITPQQNRVAESKNKTLIEAARTMLADSFLPNTFWDEAVSTACYVLNRLLVTKPQNKTPYELITGKFEEKSNEGFLVRYSLNSKAFRVYNLETKRVEENLHINFLENKPNVAGKGPTWLFDLDYLTDSMNYQPVTAENKTNKTTGPKEANNSAGTQDNIDAGNSEMEAEHVQEYFVLPLWSSYTSTVKSSEAKNGDQKLNGDTTKEADDTAETLTKMFVQDTKDLILQAGAARASSTNYVNTASTPVNTASASVNTASPSRNVSAAGPSYPDLLTYSNQDDSHISSLEDIYEVPNDRIFTSASYDVEGAMADFTNLESTVNVSPIPQYRIHSIHPTTQIFGDPNSAVQARSKVKKSSGAHAFEELLQFKTQQVWILVDLPFRKKVIGTKWVYRNKKDERGVVVRNKVRLVAQGHRQDKGIDYDEFFAPVARIEAIRIFLAFASYMGFIVYQMDVKSAFLYGKIDEEVYVSQPPGFIDPKFPNKWIHKRMSKRQKIDADLEEEEQLRVFLNIIPDEEREVNYAVLDKSPKQTTLGKDFSNPLMADSLPKTIWLSMHHVIAMKRWLFQSKRLLMTKYQMSSSSLKSRLENNKVFGYILQVIKTPKLKKHEVSLDLSRLAITLNSGAHGSVAGGAHGSVVEGAHGVSGDAHAGEVVGGHESGAHAGAEEGVSEGAHVIPAGGHQSTHRGGSTSPYMASIHQLVLTTFGSVVLLCFA
nr:putative ribonuclease H-like domain-containing protein [Tanacetum cinerariifolium]